MKKLFFAFALAMSSLALFSFTSDVGPDTFIIDGDGNVHHFNDGSNCLIDLRDGASYGDC